jgi:hypothetical protein
MNGQQPMQSDIRSVGVTPLVLDHGGEVFQGLAFAGATPALPCHD